ncbi:MAG TPA: YhfT family protein [Symbiobacteriaceae bacterium]|jgi:hypothetical protein
MMILQPLATTLLGLWAGVMAWSGWACYHDGVRPLLAECADGNLSRADLVAMADDANRPFVLGSLGLSLVVGVPLAHWLWLPAEAVGFRGRRLWQAALGGALWGLAAWGIVWGGRLLVAALPVRMLPDWDRALAVILAGMTFAPALAAYHRFGFRAGVAGLALSAAGAAAGAVWAEPGLRVAMATGLGSLAGSLTFGALVFREVRTQAPTDTVLEIRPRRAPLWALVVQGALLAFAVRAGTFGWGTADGIAAGQGLWLVGGAMVLPQVLGFAPQWAAAQASTGVGQLAGFGLPVLAGFLSPALWPAPLLGGAVVLLELPVSRFALRYPSLSEAGESMRWAMGKCSQPAIMAAMVWAAAGGLPAGLGVAVVIVAVAVNDLLPKTIWKTAVPAWGLLLAGLLANLWHVLGGV